MADSLDALKFDAIIDDKEFKASVERITNEAKQLNTNISSILTIKAKIQTTQIVSKASADNAAAVARHLETIEQKMNSLSGKKLLVGDADALNETLKKVLDKMESMEEKTKKSKDLFGEMNKELYKSKDFMGELARLTGITFGAAGIKTFLSNVVKVSGEFEVQKMALTSMLQDAGKADEIFKTLQKRALQSPYTFQDLTKYAKQLTAFNIGADQLVETEKRLADVAAGLGVDMGRIVLAYGQVKSAGVLKGTELRQFTEAGVPLLQSLADQIKETEGRAVSLSEVFRRISKKEIPFEMVEQAFRDMTSEGGKFYNMQEVLVDTLKGKIDKLRDAWQQALYKIGSANSGVLKNTVDWFVDIVTNIDKFSNLLGGLIVTFGSYIALLATCAAAQKIIFGVEYIANIGKVIKEIKAAKTAMEGFAMASNLVNVAAFALAALVGIGYAVYKSITKVDEATKRLNESMYAYEKAVDAEKKKLGELAAVLKDAEKGTDEWNKAKDEVVKSYGKYFKGLDDEITKVGNLETAYANLIKKVEESISMRKFADFYQQERSLYESQQDEFLTDIQAQLEKRLGAYEGTLAFRSFRDALLGAPGDAYSVVSQFDHFGDDLGLVLTKAKELDKAYATFWNNQQKAQERMGLGGRLFSPEALLKKLAADENPLINNTWGPNTQNEKVPKWLKERVNTIKDLQSAYKSLKKEADDAGWTEKDIDDYLKVAFSWADAELIGRRDFWAMLNEAADEMEQFDKNAANDLRSEVSKGMAQEQANDWKEKKKQEKEAQKELKDSKKALEAYQDAFKKANVKDFNVGGVGALGDAKDALADYNTELNKITNTFIAMNDKAREAYANDNKGLGWALDANKGWYEAARNAQMELLKKRAADSLAKKIFDDQMKGYDLSNWDDKSLEEINAIKNAIDNLTIPQEIREVFEEYPDVLKVIEAALDEIKKKTLEKTVKPKEMEKMAKNAKKVAEYISKAGDAMQRLGKATNDANLEDAGKALSAIGQNLSAAADGYSKSGSWIGAVVGGVLDLFNQITDAVAESNEKLREMEDTVLRIRLESESRRFNDFLSNGEDGIFGDNFVKRINNAIEAIRTFGKDMNEVYDSLFSKSRKLMDKDTEGFFTALNGFTIYDSNDSPWGSVDRIMIKTAKEFAGGTYKSLEKIAKEFDIALFDDNGFLNPVLLDKVIEEYGDLNHELKGLFTEAKQQAEQYAQAMKKIDDATKDIFGNLASDMADKFIDNYLAMGNAVDDLSDTFSNLGDAILRSFLQSYIIDEILNKYTEQAHDALRQYATGEMTPEDYAAWLDGFAQNVKEESETLAPAINGMIEAFKDRGLMNIDEDTANSLGSGIKSITEDTANLLASYINAMRADVSIMRGLQEKGWGYIESFGASLPTLNDYIAQIAATNFDIAQSNQSILSEIQSVIGAPGTSGMVVRVEAS